MDDVGDRGPRQRRLAPGSDRDSRVILYLGDGTAHHVYHPHGGGPAAAGRGAGQDDQALGVAAHARGEVIETEQVIQGLGIGGTPLHLVQQRQLTVQQRLAAPGQAAEHVVDAAAKLGLLHRGPDGGLPDQVERLADPSDLVGADPQRWRLHRHVHVVAPPQPRDDVRQLVLGEGERGRLQAAQPADDAAPDECRDEDREQQAEQRDGGGVIQPHPGRVGDLPVDDQLSLCVVIGAAVVVRLQGTGE